jgi:transcriptional regulator with XRE-family HTH domain
MDAKTTLGRAIRARREAAGISQEKLAEKADITYQYLSALENGKENFSIAVLESLAGALGTRVDELVASAYQTEEAPAKVDPGFFVPGAPLPPGLTVADLSAALDETHHVVRLLNTTLMKVGGRPLAGFIQRNNLSGIVSNILCDSFSRLTAYKHNHEQRYPDLVWKDRKRGREVGLEVKSTIRPGKGGESHNGHSGWHVVACFELNETNGDIRCVHVMFADLVGHGKAGADWRYMRSKVNAETGSQRTETYMTTPGGTAKLRHGTAYLDPSRIDFSRWRTAPEIQAPTHSPFQLKPRR